MAKTKGTGSRSKKNGATEVPGNIPVASVTPQVSVSTGAAAAPAPAPVRKESEVKENKKIEARHNVVPINLDEEIRRRAYEIYEQRGRTPGDEREDWLAAEAEILARYNVQRQYTA